MSSPSSTVSSPALSISPPFSPACRHLSPTTSFLSRKSPDPLTGVDAEICQDLERLYRLYETANDLRKKQNQLTFDEKKYNIFADFFYSNTRFKPEHVKDTFEPLKQVLANKEVEQYLKKLREIYSNPAYRIA